MGGCGCGCSPISLVHLSLVLLPRDSWVSGWHPLVCSKNWCQCNMMRCITSCGLFLQSAHMLRLASFLSLQCPDLNWARVVRSFLVRSFPELLIWGGRSFNTALLSWLLTSYLTGSVWIVWSVAFLSFANLIGTAVLRCRENSSSFMRPAGWLALLLLNGDDVDTDPGSTTTRVWICDICHKQMHGRKKSKTNNSQGPDASNIRHLKHIGRLELAFFTKCLKWLLTTT